MESDKEADEELEEIRKKKLDQMMNKQKNPMKSEPPKSGAGENLVQMNETNFWEVIRKNGRVLVDCYADWCGPCKMIEPIFHKLAEIHSEVVFGRINVDLAPTITAQFQIRGIPLLLFFKQGQLIHQLLGAQSYDTINAHIQRYLN
jgi:thioredoxin 1